jgi:hypothetical protein
VDESCAYEASTGSIFVMKTFKRVTSEFVHREDGDVPGWVLITLMTAGLVVIIWALAGPALSSVFQQAIDRVTGI